MREGAVEHRLCQSDAEAGTVPWHVYAPATHGQSQWSQKHEEGIPLLPSIHWLASPSYVSTVHDAQHVGRRAERPGLTMRLRFEKNSPSFPLLQRSGRSVRSPRRPLPFTTSERSPRACHPLGQGMVRACVHVLSVTTGEEAPQQAPCRPLQTTGYQKSSKSSDWDKSGSPS